MPRDLDRKSYGQLRLSRPADGRDAPRCPPVNARRSRCPLGVPAQEPARMFLAARPGCAVGWKWLSGTFTSVSDMTEPGSGPGMDRRIFGLENEYGVTCTFRGQRRLSPDEVARYLFRRVVSWGRSSNVFLKNGARLYLDVGSHPEYATPECDNVLDLVAHDKAGERILEGLLVDADRRLREEGIAGDIYLFKNNTDSAGNSYGCHENYLVGRHGEFS